MLCERNDHAVLCAQMELATWRMAGRSLMMTWMKCLLPKVKVNDFLLIITFCVLFSFCMFDRKGEPKWN